jgi:predicted dehydrogenase
VIKIGIIGAGGIAGHHVKKFSSMPDRCRIVAIADPVEAAVKKLADEACAKPFSKFNDFLSEVDAVIIGSPNFLHPEQTIACAQAGKHVWCEKPMALEDADAARMVAAVEKAKVTSFVGFSVRFDAQQVKMKEIYDSGVLGTPISIWSRRLSYFEPVAASSWRFQYDKSGGVMSELTAHEIDWMVHTSGDPRAVYCRKASRQHNDPRENDHLWITFDFGPEYTGTIEGSMMAPIADYYRGIVGTEASVYTTHWGGKLQLKKVKGDPDDLELPPAFNKHQHFLDVIEGKCANVADLKWGEKIVNISNKAIASAVSGQVVKI